MMRRTLSLVAATLAASLMLTDAARADDTTEARLRDALRQAITQQRSLEDSQAQLQAKLAEAQKQIELLKAEPPKKAVPDQAVIERIEAEANRRIAAQNEALAKAGETLEKWKAAYEQAATVARAKEAERVQLATQVDGLGKRAESCEAKNAKLFEAANEVLDHLKAIDVAEAMAAHEPFVGTKRVQFQNLAQDDEDRLLDQKVVVPPVQAVAGGTRP